MYIFVDTNLPALLHRGRDRFRQRGSFQGLSLYCVLSNTVLAPNAILNSFHSSSGQAETIHDGGGGRKKLSIVPGIWKFHSLPED